MASADSYFDILDNVVNSALESIQDGEDVDRQTVAENFGTLDIDAAFNDAYEDFYSEVYNRVVDEMPDDDDDAEDEE